MLSEVLTSNSFKKNTFYKIHNYNVFQIRI